MQAVKRNAAKSLVQLAAAAAIYVFILPHPWWWLDWIAAIIGGALAIAELRKLLQP
jgi:divalent metal cation (Fe/Co/Zn/Cd) transporter